ncbi:hypothetical protein NSZ01_05130 [Nocardioides szechwanensis]|nr:hypothetical protein NSZ01_05130 [Nocardioides szechwanensis]
MSMNARQSHRLQLDEERKASARAYHAMPISKDCPDRTLVDWRSISIGMSIGWLSVLESPGSADARTLVRCVCGDVTAPRALDLARGATRSCGAVSRHGRGC